MAAVSFPLAKRIPKLTAVAWVVTILISTVPDILWTCLLYTSVQHRIVHWRFVPWPRPLVP